MPIKNLQLHLKPREKALKFGLSTLTDVELLAIFIRTGCKHDVISTALNVIKKFGSLQQIANASFRDLKSLNGIGQVKALEILALFEFAKRVNFKLNKSSKIKNQNDGLKEIQLLNLNLKYENFIVIFLNKDYEILSITIMYKGTKNNVYIEPKEIVSEALKIGAYGFYCFHNHPSGNINPSENDVLITKKIKILTNILSINFMGHYIFNDKFKSKLINL